MSGRLRDGGSLPCTLYGVIVSVCMCECWTGKMGLLHSKTHVLGNHIP